MFCIRNLQRTCKSLPIKLLFKAKYSRGSDSSTNTFKFIQSDETLDDVDNTIFGVNPNWELLTPRGFRFYLPGSIGPGWLDASTTAQVEITPVLVSSEMQELDLNETRKTISRNTNNIYEGNSILHCTAQECPLLLRKGILELFPNCIEVTSPQLTIITITQRINKISKWSKESKIEKLAQYFVLAASGICKKLKSNGYWADFINPFSGQPYLNPYKNKILYQTDERFRSVGFKVERKANCKIIAFDNNARNFIGNIYTSAPANVKFLKDAISTIDDINDNINDM